MKLFLIAFSYTHRSLSCSTIIREASSCSRWELMHRPIMGQCEENKRLLSPKREVFIKFLPSGLRELYRKVDEKVMREDQGKGGSMLFRHKKPGGIEYRGYPTLHQMGP